MPIPQPVDMLLNTPLYDKRVANGVEEQWRIVDTLYFEETYDSYCAVCGRESTFKAIHRKRPNDLYQPLPSPLAPPNLEAGLYSVSAECTRCSRHQHTFQLLHECPVKPDSEKKPRRVHSIVKIGQYPSAADLLTAEVRKYKPVLSDSQLFELSRAIGLAAHGVGIGAFVYLRRIFEALVAAAHDTAKKQQDWDEDREQEYLSSRMVERIKLLAHELPDFLVDQANMYSILSKGVHELSEEECLKHFETVKLSIELILDEQLEHKLREAKTKRAKKAIKKAGGDLAS